MLKVAGGGGGTTGGVVYRGTWNANTNNPALASGVGTKGDYYVVSVSGNTNLDGITDWVAGDWAIFNGVVWQKVDNTESVISVNGQTGVVVLTAANVNAVSDTATITAGTGLTGGGTLASNTTISLANTAVTAGTYGGNTNVAVVTINAQGRVTNASNVAISYPSSYSNLSVDLIDFNELANLTPTASQMTWDNNDRRKTIAVGVNGDVLYVFEDSIIRVKAQSTITKGQVIMFVSGVGASGGILAAPATGLDPTQANYIIGVAMDNIATNGWGNVMTSGELRGLDTTGGGEGWVVGEELYYNPSVTGGLTKTKPTAPAAITRVADVINVSASNGIIYVRLSYGSVLGGTDGNVNFTSLANNDVIIYNSTTNVWVNKPNANVVAGTGLTGGGAVIANTNVSIALANTAVTAGIYGGSSNSAVITIDAQGRITSASNAAISGGGGSNTVVTNLVTITNGSQVGWANNTSVVLSWTNNSAQVIAWLSGVYQATSNNATILVNCAAEPLSVQLPSAATVSGQQFIVKKIDSSANAATITTTSSQKIDNANTYALSAQYMAAGVQSDGSNYWVILEAT